MTDREAQLERRVEDLESEVAAILARLESLQEALAMEDFTLASGALDRPDPIPSD